jgi:hypothetical protein
MSDDAPPIDPDEFLLRRIPITGGYFDPKKAPPVQSGAFRPNRGDTDGISIYRERLLSASELVAKTNRVPGTTKVARLRVRDLQALGVTLEPKQEEGDLPGHVVIPEINYADYDSRDPARNERPKALCKSLTDLANKPGATLLPDTNDTSIQ